MFRCALCGSSRFDSEGVACVRCGGSPALPEEGCRINEETKGKLMAHAKELKSLGATVLEYKPLRKSADTVVAAAALAIAIADSFDNGALRKLVVFLRDLSIPEEQIIRLRLDERKRLSNSLGQVTERRRKRLREPLLENLEEALNFPCRVDHE